MTEDMLLTQNSSASAYDMDGDTSVLSRADDLGGLYQGDQPKLAVSPIPTLEEARSEDSLLLPMAPPKKRRTRKKEPAWTPTPEQRAAWAEEERAAKEREAARALEERSFWIRNRKALLELAQDSPTGSGRSTFTQAGCVGAILGTIVRLNTTRDDIVRAVAREYRYSYRHIGYLLTKLTGTDPNQHLWFKDEDRRFHLLAG